MKQLNSRMPCTRAFWTKTWFDQRSFTPGHVFKCKKTTARRLHLAKELLTFLVEALKYFAETKEGTSEKVLQFCGESADPNVQTSQFVSMRWRKRCKSRFSLAAISDVETANNSASLQKIPISVLNIDEKYIASRFCCNLEKSLSPLFKDAAYRDFDLNLSLNWQEIVSAFDNWSVAVWGAKYVTNDYVSVTELTS